jgi:hypothetical protein
VFTIMIWNAGNFFTPKPADREAYDAEVPALANVITAATRDLLALQEIGDEERFEVLRDLLRAGWSGVLSAHFESPHTIRVDWISPGALADVEQVLNLPAALSPVKVDDDGTTITQLGGSALAVTHTTTAGTRVEALTAHLKSKLLSFRGGRFGTTDEAERALYGVHALDRHAEAAAVRDSATTALAGDWAAWPLLVCGDLNDTTEAATTQLLLGPPGSQIGTGGFSHPDHRDRQRLWDVGYSMNQPNNFSLINQGRPELIDCILVSHALVGHPTDSATVPLDILSIDVHPGVAPRTDPPADHRPVLAHFAL